MQPPTSQLLRQPSSTSTFFELSSLSMSSSETDSSLKMNDPEQQQQEVLDQENLGPRPVPRRRSLQNRGKWIFAVAVLVGGIILAGVLIWYFRSSSAINKDFVLKTKAALEHPPNGTYGRVIYSKLTGGCLDYETIKDKDMSRRLFIDRPAGECTASGAISQQWILDPSGQLTNWKKMSIKAGTSAKYCARRLEETETQCLRKSFDKYSVVVNTKKIDAKKERVYFSLKSLDHPELCLGLCRECMEHVFFKVYLFECSGADDQLFYLQGVDYKEAFSRLKGKWF